MTGLGRNQSVLLRPVGALFLTGWLGLGLVLGDEVERLFDFSAFRAGDTPEGFHSMVVGEGQPGDWKVLHLDSAGVAGADPIFPATVREGVLAQLSKNPTDEHFPMLIYERETYGDFRFSADVRTVSGEVEQMAGLVFRFKDDRNFYALRLSSLGGTVRFYKVVDGVRQPPVGVERAVPTGRWFQLAVECRGNEIRCFLDGQSLFGTLVDNSFTEGRVGFWTKSDSVSWFRNARVVYTPRVTLAMKMHQAALQKYTRLIGLKLYALEPGTSEVRVVASTDPSEIGSPAGEVETDVVRNGTIYSGKENETCSVVMPIRDRNGDPVAAARVIMKTFAGQTRDNILARAMPVVHFMQDQVGTASTVTR